MFLMWPDAFIFISCTPYVGTGNETSDGQQVKFSTITETGTTMSHEIVIVMS
jgi:hypothetical protein